MLIFWRQTVLYKHSDVWFFLEMERKKQDSHWIYSAELNSLDKTTVCTAACKGRCKRTQWTLSMRDAFRMGLLIGKMTRLLYLGCKKMDIPFMTAKRFF